MVLLTLQFISFSDNKATYFQHYAAFFVSSYPAQGIGSLSVDGTESGGNPIQAAGILSSDVLSFHHIHKSAQCPPPHQLSSCQALPTPTFLLILRQWFSFTLCLENNLWNNEKLLKKKKKRLLVLLLGASQGTAVFVAVACLFGSRFLGKIKFEIPQIPRSISSIWLVFSVFARSRPTSPFTAEFWDLSEETKS